MNGTIHERNSTLDPKHCELLFSVLSLNVNVQVLPESG